MTLDKESDFPPAKRDILDLVKGDGPWQRLIFFVCFVCSIPLASHNLVMSFYAPNLDHWCARPLGFNITVQEWKNLALPPDDPSCSRYEYVNASAVFKGTLNFTQRSIVPCNSWEYDDSVYISTVLSKWDLVCSKQWLVSMSKSIFTGGYLCSVMLFGFLSDKYGRRPVFAGCNVIALVSSIVCAFSTSFMMFAVLRFFIAVGTAGVLNTAFVLLMEVVGPDYRSVYGIGINFGWCLGFVTLPGIAWLLPDWFWIQMVITIPSLLLLSSWWLLPESPRWLLSQGKTDEAVEILIKAGRSNGVQNTVIHKELKEIFLSKSKPSEDNSGNFLDLLRKPGLWQKSLNLFYLWCVIAFMYFGLSYNTNELAGDPFINFAASGAIEIPANFICIFIIISFGRRNPLAAFLMIGAVACLAMYFVPEDPWWIGVIVSMIGKFGITCAFSIIYVYTAEIFPTVLRNVGMGSASLCGRVGSIVAPFVRELGNATHPVLPQVIFGILAATGSLFVLLLPETNNCSVPDTVLEAAQVTRKKVPIKKSDHMMMKELMSEKT